jgi:hypothetical protein
VSSRGSGGHSAGRAMAQAVIQQAVPWLRRSFSRPCRASGGQLPDTAETRLQSQASECGICGGQSVIGTGLLPALLSPLVSIIPPTPQAHSSPTLRKFSSCQSP